MNEERLEAYQKLIDAVLNCSEGEEWELLQAHQELLDPNFLEMMEQAAEELKKKGDEERADFLGYLIDELMYQDIIVQLLNCGNNEEALQILDNHRDWVDARLNQIMLEVAEHLRIEGDLDRSNFLMNLVEQLMGLESNTSGN